MRKRRAAANASVRSCAVRSCAVRFCAVALLAAVPAGMPTSGAPLPPTAEVGFAAVPGWADDDHAAALHAFRATCAAVRGAVKAVRPALPPPPALRPACEAARRMPARPGEAAARAFFQDRFTPRRVQAAAFFTGYFEPVVEGSLVRSPAFPVPLLAPPADLVPAPKGAIWSRRRPDGSLAPMPDRAAIEAGALGAAAPPLAWLREPADAFFVQVQGSARLVLPDGTMRRLAYAGRNGYPYTAIGKVLVDTLGIPPERMGMGELKSWIRAHGQGPGDAGTALMERNRSFIFFRFDDGLPTGSGPVGAAGVPLEPLRTLAVDRAVWPYGLPFYVATDLPAEAAAAPMPFRRLAVAADTGSAIVGPARADIFFGTGAEAGARAGDVRQPGTLFVLWPKAGPAGAVTP